MYFIHIYLLNTLNAAFHDQGTHEDLFLDKK